MLEQLGEAVAVVVRAAKHHTQNHIWTGFRNMCIHDGQYT